MLTALKDYAIREKLVVVPGMKPKTVRWLLVFSSQGEFLGANDLTGGNRKSKGREFPGCPDLTQQEMVGIGGGCRHFLVDSLDVVSLFTKDGEVDEKLTAKHEFFVNLLAEAKECLPPLGAVADTLRDDAQLACNPCKPLTEGKAKPTDAGTFTVVSPTATRPLSSRAENGTHGGKPNGCA